eukprot:605293_1
MVNTLYSYTGDYRAQATLVAAQYNGVEIEVPEFKFPADCRSAEFKAKNPTQKVPLLEAEEGCVFESKAILRHVARQSPRGDLIGCSSYEQTLVDQWVEFCSHELEVPRNVWLLPVTGAIKFDRKAAKAARQEVQKCLTIIDAHLLSRTFMVGNAVTLADIALGSTLVAMFQKVFAPEFRAKYTNLTRWFTTLIAQPEWRAVFGTVSLCDKEQTAEGEKNQGKKQQKKKAEKKPEQAAAKPAKRKNPLDALPRSKTMDLETTKRLFSNNKFDVAIKTFWETFDAEGYSCFTTNYNYNDENTVDFQTSNLCTGYLQRLDSLRKYGFGALNIWGTESTKGPFNINGAWVFRGVGVPFEFSDCPDSEYHTITPVDLNDAAQKAKFEALLGGAEEFEGQPKYERKYFK